MQAQELGARRSQMHELEQVSQGRHHLSRPCLTPVLLHNASYLTGTQLLGEPKVLWIVESRALMIEAKASALWFDWQRAESLTEMPMSQASHRCISLALNQDGLHNLQGPLQDENAGPLVQPFLRMSRGCQQSIQSSIRSFWAKRPGQRHRSQAH